MYAYMYIVAYNKTIQYCGGGLRNWFSGCKCGGKTALVRIRDHRPDFHMCTVYYTIPSETSLNGPYTCSYYEPLLEPEA